MRKAHAILLLICGIFLLVNSGCMKDCCRTDRSPEVLWPKAIVAPVTPKPEPPKVEEKELPKVMETPKEEEVKIVEDTPKEPEKKPKEEALIDLPEIPPLEVQVVIESAFEGDQNGAVGTPAKVTCKAVNKGAATVDNGQLMIMLPEGLTVEGEIAQGPVVKPLGTLAPNADFSVPLSLVAEKSGPYILKAEVRAGEKVVSTSKPWTVTFVAKPQATLAVEGPANGQTGQQFSYTLAVTNTGRESLQNLKVQTLLHDGLILDGTEPEGQYLEDKREVNWMISSLEPNAKKEYKVKVTYLEQAKVVNYARVLLGKEILAKGKLETVIKTDIGLAVNQYDSTDPVEVGQKTAYVIDISNSGFKEATEVGVVYTIPAESKFVSATVEGVDGINHTAEERTITFDKVPAIKPGQKVTFKVTVEVLSVGDLLNSVTVTTKDFDKPVTTQEGTKSYKKQD